MTTIAPQDELTLPTEDGKSAALALPFDKQNSEVAFETATFGLG